MLRHHRAHNYQTLYCCSCISLPLIVNCWLQTLSFIVTCVSIVSSRALRSFAWPQTIAFKNANGKPSDFQLVFATTIGRIFVQVTDKNRQINRVPLSQSAKDVGTMESHFTIQELVPLMSTGIQTGPAQVNVNWQAIKRRTQPLKKGTMRAVS